MPQRPGDNLSVDSKYHRIAKRKRKIPARQRIERLALRPEQSDRIPPPLSLPCASMRAVLAVSREPQR
jgi:hypothetical protein